MKHRKIVLCEAFPTHEQPAEAIVPTVRPLDDPAPWESEHASEKRLLASTSNVRRDAAQAHGGFAVLVVVALVEAQVTWTPRSARSAQYARVEHSTNQPLVVHVRCGDHDRQRNSAPVGEHMPFYAEFPAIRRARPRVAPPLGALTMALSSEAKSHLMPRRLS